MKAVRLIDGLAWASTVVVLLVTPWPLGSRLPWAETLAATAMLGTAGTWLGARLLLGAPPAGNRLFLPVVAFLLLGIVQLAADITVYSFATELDLLSLSAYAAMLLLVSSSCVGPRRRSGLALALLVSALAVSCFAIVQHLTWNGKLFWFYEPPMGGTSPFGPFNNRNYHAGYMVAALGPALGLLAAPRTGAWRWLAGLGVITAAVSVILSLSRGGVLAMGAAFLAVLLVVARGHRTLRRAVVTVVALALVLGAVVAAIAALGQADRVTARLTTLLQIADDRSASDRLTIWRDSLQQIAERPLLGSGLRTFVWGHLAHRSSMNGLPLHAHNEYLEMLAEAGLLGGSICLWFLWLLYRQVTAGLRAKPAGFEAGIRLGALVSWWGILAFSLTDFPTVIPATNYVLAAVAGLAVAAAGDPTGERIT